MSSRQFFGLLVVSALGFIATPRAHADWTFQRGDCNVDGMTDIGDAIALLGELFSGGTPGPCADACDANDDGAKDIGDAIALLGHLFSGTGPLPNPFGSCGEDPTTDALDCIGPIASCPDGSGGYDSSLLEPPRVPPAAPCNCYLTQPDRFGHRSHQPADSVHLFSGEFYEEWIDMHIPGVGLDFLWVRTYRSRLETDGVMGHQWDHSYNIRIEADGADVILYGGNARRDRLTAPPGGAYETDGIFASGQFEPGGAFVLSFGNGGEWRLAPLDGSPAEGKIQEIGDRYGNTLQFTYDASGRLTQIVDTLGRPIDVSYDSAGRVIQVADHAGRTTQFAHYDGISVGGAAGDLMSVTTTAVVGTPTQNDFPAGKTTTYLYDDAHRLTEIVLPSGRSLVQNSYATSGPSAGEIIRQDWDSATGHFNFWSAAVIPDPANGNAVRHSIVNDPLGVVREYFYDAENRCVWQQEFTGFGDPTVPTTPTTNRPTGPLRSSDPPFFETRLEWNEDSLQTQVTLPNGNVQQVVYERSLNSGASPQTRGNPRQSLRSPGTHVPAGDQSQTIEQWQYLPGFGGCCAHEFVTEHQNVCGDTTTHSYDGAANRVQTQQPIPGATVDMEYDSAGRLTAVVHPSHQSGPPFERRRDEFLYHTSGVGEGYLATRIVNAGGLGLTTQFEYDAVGNLTSVTDPAGADAQYEYNALDQVVRKLTRPVDSTSGVRYESLYFYDDDDALVRVCRENRDGDGLIVTGNVYITSMFEYDARGHLTRTCEEFGSFDVPLSPPQLDCAGLPPSDFVTTELLYDEMGQLIHLRFGEATDGTQSANTETHVRDERGLLFQHIRGAGSTAESTDQYDYDANGNVTRVERGLPAGSKVTTNSYDGYDRLVETVDPMGNVTTQHFDAADRLTNLRSDGELVDLPGSTANLRLWELVQQYDALGRLTQEDVAFFDPVTQAPIDDGSRTTTTSYNPNSQWISRTDDDGATTTMAYDSVARPTMITDALGNVRQFMYDANSRITTILEVEVPTISTVPVETYLTSSSYDGLGRLTSHSDSSGNTHTFSYDSRGNRVAHVDARGNRTTIEVDGMNRELASHREMTDNGVGTGTVVSILTTTQSWDRSSRLVARSDGNGNATQYQYDELNRLTQVIFADGTTRSTTYDTCDDPVSVTDANGSTIATTHDLLGRPTERTITPGSGVSSDTTFESLRYDGLSRLVSGEDDDSLMSRSYDSLYHLTTESLNGLSVTNTWDGVGNMLSISYPNGRQVQCAYDLLRRKTSISEAPGGFLLASYEYIGPEHRVLTRSCGTGTDLTYSYDGARRISRTQHIHNSSAGPVVIDDRGYSWNGQYSKSERTDLRVGGTGVTELFSYDSSSRLVQTEETMFGTVLGQTNYALDPAGNRTSVSGGVCSGTFILDPTLPEPADAQVNQYTSTPCGPRSYDQNGNLIARPAVGAPSITYSYDARNRLVEYSDPLSGRTVEFSYDVLGRRTEKTVLNPTGGSIVTTYSYDGMHVVEERDGGGQTVATFAYGNLVDELLHMRRHLGPLTDDIYFRSDDLGSVHVAVDSSGAPVERVEYDEFGAPSFFGATGAPLAGSSVGNWRLFNGRLYDAELGLYWYRSRFYDPAVGRFISRDSIGIWGDPLAQGNGSTYVGNDPASRTDPTGEGSKEKFVRDKPHVNIGTIGHSAQAVGAIIDGNRYSNSGGIAARAAGDGLAVPDSGATAEEERTTAGGLIIPDTALIAGQPWRKGEASRMAPSQLRTYVSRRAKESPGTPIDPPSLQLEAGPQDASSNKLFVGGLSWSTEDTGLASKKLFVGGLSWTLDPPALASHKLFVGGLSWTHSQSPRSQKLFVGGLSFSGDPDRPVIVGTVPNGVDPTPSSDGKPKRRTNNGRSTIRPYDL